MKRLRHEDTAASDFGRQFLDARYYVSQQRAGGYWCEVDAPGAFMPVEVDLPEMLSVGEHGEEGKQENE